MPGKSADSGKDTKQHRKKKNEPAGKKKAARSAIALQKTGTLPGKTGRSKTKQASRKSIVSTRSNQKEERKSAELKRPQATIERRTVQKDLPDSYGTPKVVLMPVDPYLMHVYWEVVEQDLENTYRRLRGKYNELQPTLRFFDVTGIDFDDTNTTDHFDIPIDLQAGNWYVHLKNAARKYVAELGIKTEGGSFSPLIRSNQAETPPDMPRPREPERFIFVSTSDARRTEVPLPSEMQRGHYISASFSPRAAKALRIINQETYSDIFEHSAFEPEESTSKLHSIESRHLINENIDVIIEKSFTPGLSSGTIRLPAIPVKSTSKK